jgi:DNA-binding NtrC family response regulator
VIFMNSSSKDNSPEPEPVPVGIVLGRDLVFTAKVTGTAGELGYRMRVAGDVATARALIEELRPRVILVDLAAGELAAPQVLSEYRRLAGPSAWLIAAGPHVDAQRLAQATEAGCQLALPRSKFSTDLPALLRRCFDEPADLSSKSHVSHRRASET